MTEHRSYTYTTLRYVHDVRTGEFLNVGVVLHAASLGRLEFKTCKTFGRAKRMFSDLDGDAFHDAMRAVDRVLAAQARQPAEAALLAGDGNAVAIARQALPADDSTLQWSELGSDVSDDLTKALDRLYARMVMRHDTDTHVAEIEDEVRAHERQRG